MLPVHLQGLNSRPVSDVSAVSKQMRQHAGPSPPGAALSGAVAWPSLAVAAALAGGSTGSEGSGGVSADLCVAVSSSQARCSASAARRHAAARSWRRRTKSSEASDSHGSHGSLMLVLVGTLPLCKAKCLCHTPPPLNTSRACVFTRLCAETWRLLKEAPGAEDTALHISLSLQDNVRARTMGQNVRAQTMGQTKS